MEFELLETAIEGTPCLETIRALHQTVVALRSALEQSRSEVLKLKQGVWHDHVVKDEGIKPLIPIFQKEPCLVQEDYKSPKKQVRIFIPPLEPHNLVLPVEDTLCLAGGVELPVTELIAEEELNNASNITENNSLIEISIAIEKLSSKKFSKSLENLTIVKTQKSSFKQLGISKTLSFSNINNEKEMSENYRKGSMDNSRSFQSNVSSPRRNIPSLNVSSSPNISQVAQSIFQTSIISDGLENAQSEPALQTALDQNEEVDDIELIFTTEETKDSDFKGELVPIESSDTNLHHDIRINRHLQRPISDLERSFSDRELEDDVFNESESQDNSNTQSNPFRRENSQLYNSKSDNSINQEEKSLKSYYSYQDSSFENKSLEKDESFDRFEERIRIVETDISKCGIVDVDYITGRRNTCPNPLPYRPIIHREALGKGLNTRKGRPILSSSNNTRRESEAQTDISALPSSSWRSESSLAHKVKVGEHFTTLPSKFPLPGSRLRLSEKTNVEARRVLLSDIGFTSMVPELSRSADHLCPANVKNAVPVSYGQFLRTTDLYSPGFMSQKFSWTATTTASPSEVSQLQSRFGSMYPLSPPAPSRRFSAPVSPSRRVTIKPALSKVHFANGSLPELRGEWSTTADSGDSTDSLVEEAENYLRRSIDCIVTGVDLTYRNEIKSRSYRRASAPEPAGDNVPPQDWQPFLPRNPRDLHLDHWVKVIVPEGRVRGGRVRYVGPLLNQIEQHVGVQLSTPDGHSDGTYNNRCYFNCEPYHGIFVPFKKVVMGWRP